MFHFFWFLKGYLNKQCCSSFLCHLLFLEYSADLKTCLLFLSSSMRLMPHIANALMVFWYSTLFYNAKLKASPYRIVSNIIIFFAIGPYVGNCKKTEFSRVFHFAWSFNLGHLTGSFLFHFPTFTLFFLSALTQGAVVIILVCLRDWITASVWQTVGWKNSIWHLL